MTNTEIIREITRLEQVEPDFDVEYFGYNKENAIVAVKTFTGEVIGLECRVVYWEHESIAE